MEYDGDVVKAARRWFDLDDLRVRVVLADAQTLDRKILPAAALSGKDGMTTQTGLIVMPSGDPAQRITDLQGDRILFSPADCNEKHAAPLALLRRSGVVIHGKVEMSQACGRLDAEATGVAWRQSAGHARHLDIGSSSRGQRRELLPTRSCWRSHLPAW